VPLIVKNGWKKKAISRMSKAVILLIDLYLVGWLVGWFMVFLRHFQRYFNYIVAVSFIGGGNRSNIYIYILRNRN
jgi:hypothetical protein